MNTKERLAIVFFYFDKFLTEPKLYVIVNENFIRSKTQHTVESSDSTFLSVVCMFRQIKKM